MSLAQDGNSNHLIAFVVAASVFTVVVTGAGIVFWRKRRAQRAIKEREAEITLRLHRMEFGTLEWGEKDCLTEDDDWVSASTSYLKHGDKMSSSTSLGMGMGKGKGGKGGKGTWTEMDTFTLADSSSSGIEDPAVRTPSQDTDYHAVVV